MVEERALRAVGFATAGAQAHAVTNVAADLVELHRARNPLANAHSRRPRGDARQATGAARWPSEAAAATNAADDASKELMSEAIRASRLLCNTGSDVGARLWRDRRGVRLQYRTLGAGLS